MKKNFDFHSKFKIANTISVLFVLGSLLLIFFKGLNLGIDFKGGLNFEVKSNLTTNQLNEYFDFIDCDREVLIKREVGSDVFSIRIESGDNNPVFIEEIKIALKNNERVELRGFATFSIRKQKSRLGRNGQ